MTPPRLPHDCLQCPGGLRESQYCAQVESVVILTVKILIKLSLSGLTRYVIRHFRDGKETGPSLLSQRLLGLSLGTGKKKLANRRVPSNNPRNPCQTNSAPVSLIIVSKMANKGDLTAVWEGKLCSMQLFKKEFLERPANALFHRFFF